VYNYTVALKIISKSVKANFNWIFTEKLTHTLFVLTLLLFYTSYFPMMLAVRISDCSFTAWR